MYRTTSLLIGMIMILAIPCLVLSSTEDSHILTVTDIEKIIKEYMVGHTPWGEDQIKLKNISVPNNVLLSSGWAYDIAPAPKSALMGRSVFSLNFTPPGGATQTSWISADIEVWVDAVLTSRSMKDHQVISENDVYIGKKELAELPPEYVQDVKDVVGKILKRSTGANRPLTEDILEEPPLFKRGEKVFIVAESETLKVIAVGMATSDGYRGRPAKIINMQSKKEVLGEVVDGTTVKVKW